ncbi:MAG: GAF domain-containing protein [Bacteroidales bacterium]|nr:GAF domain-containing protein [Bacteroidales bacterium]
MKIKLKIQQKIQLFIISASIIIYIVAVGYISFNARKMAYDDAIKITNQHVKETAKDIKAQLDANLYAVIALTDALKVYENFGKDEWQELVHKMYSNVFKENEGIYALWSSWELSKVDPEWTLPYGRISHTFWRENNIIKEQTELRSLDGDSPIYASTKKVLNPSINEPYMDVVSNGSRESLLMTSLKSVVVNKGEFIAVVAFDITLLQFQELVEKIKPYEGSNAFIISNGGLIAGHPNKDLLNQKIEEIFPEDNKTQKISEKVNSGESFSYTSKDENGTETYYTYSPIFIGETNTPWSIAISVPVDTIMATANKNFRISLLVGIIGILLMAVVIAIIGKSITNPLTKITSLLKHLANGHIDEKMRIKIESGDEIEEMADALNSSIEGLNNKVDFANNIGKGDLDHEFELLSTEDVLGQSLLEMRDSLIKADKENNLRKQEDEKRRWLNEGLAQFADILRQNNDNLENLATEIIMSLVDYLKANQGGLFILNDEDKDKIYFNLLSAFAYDRRKYLERHIQLGEGLIGTCAVEKKTIFMTDIPPDYIEITSGLGGASPSCLLIVPMKLEDDVLGVLEIASFNVFEKHEIEFIEKLAESIASTMSSVRVNIQTNELLERSQQQAEEMAAQEEEMRQNMEELQATQEESTRKTAEMEGLVEALNTSSYVIEYDLEGYIQKVNDNYLTLLQLSREEVVGTHHSGNMEFTDEQKTKYDKFWRELMFGKIMKETSKIKIHNKEFVFAETYTPIRNAEGEIYKVLKISNNITDFHKKE